MKTNDYLLISIVWIFGIFSISVYSLNTKLPGIVFANSLLFAGSAFFIGGLLGFLFGIPRKMHGDGGLLAETEQNKKVLYRVNTNLEQISDWLTKIFVGVSLTQLNNLPNKLSSLSIHLNLILGGEPSSGVYGISILTYYFVAGFLCGYLITRIYVGRLFHEADTSYLEDQIAQLQEQPYLDSNANDIADRLLSINPTVKKPSESETVEAFKKASTSARLNILNKAEKIRADNKDRNKELMVQTIPVFEALKKAENDHRYFAQLAYALKDKENPEYKEAIENLTEAIKIRGDYKKMDILYMNLIEPFVIFSMTKTSS